MVKSVILSPKSYNMKHLVFIALIAALIAGCAGKSSGTDETAQTPVTAVANKTATIAIEGMTCSGCENTISEAVTKIAGITEIKASHLDSTAVVSFDSTQTSLAAIGEVINEAGYVYKGEKTTAAPTLTK